MTSFWSDCGVICLLKSAVSLGKNPNLIMVSLTVGSKDKFIRRRTVTLTRTCEKDNNYFEFLEANW